MAVKVLVVDDSGFNSPTDFIVYVLRDLMGDAEGSKVEHEYSPDELDEVRHPRVAGRDLVAGQPGQLAPVGARLERAEDRLDRRQ